MPYDDRSLLTPSDNFKPKGIVLYQGIAWVDYYNFNIPSLHTWTICSKHDDMAFLLFHQRYYFDQCIANTMKADTIEKHDIRSSSSHVDNLIFSQPIGNYNSPINFLRSRIPIL